MQDRLNDPYNPPPRHKDKSGVLVRLAMLAVLIGAVIAGWAYYAPRIDREALAPAMSQDTNRDYADAERMIPAEPVPLAQPAVEGESLAPAATEPEPAESGAPQTP